MVNNLFELYIKILKRNKKIVDAYPIYSPCKNLKYYTFL